ncbi:unnamed protein product [Urochloa decumbens]|uniref:RING-type domain-containing protein n=1 Tax=Urochloa decumbens TaxID=240449 RepID=A0ABC9H448_9POAL
MTASWSSLMSPEAYKSPAFIALVTVLCVALVLLLHHCVLVTCCRRRSGSGTGADRRRRRQHHHRHHNNQQQQQETEDEEEEVSISVEVSAATSRTHLVKAAEAASPAVVCRYRKEEEWKEPTCAVCLADFDDGEAVRVLPECLHYFHAECIGTWLQGSTSCPMCRAETTPTATPSPASMHHGHRHLELNVSVSVSLEEILVRT